MKKIYKKPKLKIESILPEDVFMTSLESSDNIENGLWDTWFDD